MRSENTYTFIYKNTWNFVKTQESENMIVNENDVSLSLGKMKGQDYCKIFAFEITINTILDEKAGLVFFPQNKVAVNAF